MPSAHAHAHNPEDDHTGDGSVAPLLLGDVDRILLDSARAARAGSAAPVRAWRDDLTEALAVLNFAETTLSGDAALLRHCLATGPLDHKQVIDGLARAVSGGEGPAAIDLPLDETVFVRADQLLSVHQRMAWLDFTERAAVRRLLDDVESQLNEVTARRMQVEVRLGAIRSAVIRQYREGHVPSPESWLG